MVEPVAARSDERKRVVILGGGFAGINAAMDVAKLPVDVTMVDRKNYHLFQPLLYQVALAVLSPAEIAQPIRSLLRNYRNVEVLMDEAVGFDLPEHRVHLKTGVELEYDYLIVATGSTHSYFGRDDWAKLAPGLKTVEDATEIRRRVLLAFELAEREMMWAEGRRVWSWRGRSATLRSCIWPRIFGISILQWRRC
jgi:NADH dehydrogenase